MPALPVKREREQPELRGPPGRVLPPAETAQGGVLFDHPARALVAPTTAHVYREAVPAAFPAHPVPLALALARPRRFHEDHVGRPVLQVYGEAVPAGVGHHLRRERARHVQPPVEHHPAAPGLRARTGGTDRPLGLIPVPSRPMTPPKRVQRR